MSRPLFERGLMRVGGAGAGADFAVVGSGIVVVVVVVLLKARAKRFWNMEAFFLQDCEIVREKGGLMGLFDLGVV